MKIKTEACIGSDGEQPVFEAVSAAYEGGADTIELCSAMHQDGLTPTAGQIGEARRAFRQRPGLMVMIRPRAGDFCYTEPELQLMLTQIKMAAEAGADGVVLGPLHQNDHRIAIEPLSRLLAVSEACDLQVTIHRAFDATPNWPESLDQLIELGVDRVLTSGIAWGQVGSAVDGLPQLKEMVTRGNGRIEFVVGGGVGAQNGAIISHALSLHVQLLENDRDHRISLHAYSGIQENGVVTASAVRALVAAGTSPTSNHRV